MSSYFLQQGDESVSILNIEVSTKALGTYIEGEYELKFDFSMESKEENFVLYQGDETPHLLSEMTIPPSDRKSLSFSFNEENSIIELKNALEEALNDYPVPFTTYTELNSSALCAAADLMLSNPEKHNVFNIHIHVIVVHTHRYVETSTMGLRINQRSNNESFMIPASTSSIQSLVIKKMYSIHGSCCICMEDFSTGWEEVAYMPCSHVFHGNCIKKWLRTSHFCPICRFKMPTN